MHRDDYNREFINEQKGKSNTKNNGDRLRSHYTALHWKDALVIVLFRALQEKMIYQQDTI